MLTEEIPLGPVDYVVIEFPDAKFAGEGLPLLLKLVDDGIIRILDAAFVKSNDDGSFVAFDVADLDGLGGEWAVLVGASSGMLSTDDHAAAIALAAPGSAVAVLVYENTWAAPFATAMRRAGGQLVSFGRVSVEDMATALEIESNFLETA